MGLTEVAALLGVSRQRAHQLSKVDGFPEPTAKLSAGLIWLRADVERWARETGRIEWPAGHGREECPGDTDKH
jgi:hypothetical protein